MPPAVFVPLNGPVQFPLNMRYSNGRSVAVPEIRHEITREADVGKSDKVDAICANMAFMNKTEAVTKLKGYADAIRAMGATSLYVFGSTVRDEASADSDLDLFIDYDPDSKFSLFDLVDIKLLLEAELGMEVDVTTRDSLHPMLRKDIEQSAVRVF